MPRFFFNFGAFVAARVAGNLLFFYPQECRRFASWPFSSGVFFRPSLCKILIRMRILILTQPLYTNYGGLLQAYALQRVLRCMGHEVWTEDRPKHRTKRSFERLRRSNTLRRWMGKKPVYFPSDEEQAFIVRHTRAFVDTHIVTTPLVCSSYEHERAGSHFDAYVVGSDQVWRPRYSPCLENYFLDFVQGAKVRRIAYAASFGTDTWELTGKQTKICGNLLRQFDAVSVREDSGVELCRRHFGVEAVCMPDPTMMLTSADYELIAQEEESSQHVGELLVYMLDRSKEKQAIVQHVAERMCLQVNEVMPREKFKEVGADKLADCVYPSVGNWLRGFCEARFVVTDSFHGVVFSLLFNKPFVAVGNVVRGIARFTSLLTGYGLQERLVTSVIEVTDTLLFAPMSWGAVNEKVSRERERAIAFLKENLQERKKPM